MTWLPRLTRREKALAIAPIFFVVVNFVLVLGFTRIHFASLVHAIYTFNTLLLPFLFTLTALVAWRLPTTPKNQPYRNRLPLLWFGAALALVGTRIYATHIEPNALQVREVEIRSAKIDTPFTLLHISDIQSAAIGAYETRVFERIRALDPDLIVHTGDLLQPVAPATYHTEMPKLAALFSTLSPRLGMYMVQGDTTGPLLHLKPEQTGGIAFLRNQEAVIEAEGIDIRLYGLTLRSSTARTWARHGIMEWLQESPGSLHIVMGHRPDFILKFNDLPIDLCLAGHTHGGQIRIPFIGPLVTFSRIPNEWARGFHAVGNTWLNVSAGIGAEHAGGLPSIRVNCPPEMTLIHVFPATT